MKKTSILLTGLLMFSLPYLQSCDKASNNSDSASTEWVDYADRLKFDSNSGRVYQETTVQQYIDGDTTHFNVSWAKNGVYKARYLGIDTPESTGAIEPWGKAASKFTETKLRSATSIIIESDTAEWTYDSTGTRYMTWVWYRTSDTADYRLLNLEIVQEGLSMLKNASSTSYGDYFTDAYAQALANKLKVAGGQKDPDYYYGGPLEVTIAEVILNTETYSGVKIRFEGLVTKVDGTTFYIEDYDAITDRTYGMQVFCGYNFTGANLLVEGNYMSICGVFSYSDIVSRWQVSDLKYMAMMPDYIYNIKVLETNRDVTPKVITVDDLIGNIDITIEDEKNDEVVTKTFEKGFLALSTNVCLENLKVKSIYTTNNGGDNDGALTITCEDADGKEVIVRTSVLYNSSGNLVLASEYEGKTINVKGIVDAYDGKYQVHAFFYSDISIL